MGEFFKLIKTVWVLQSHCILYWLYDGTSADTRYCPVSKCTIPCILAGGDHLVSYWQPRSACQLAAYVLLLERLYSSFMWMLLITHYVSCFPFISPPLSFYVLLHNRCAVPQYLEIYCLDKRMWKKRLLICKHICNAAQYQVHFIYCFKLCQAAWLNSTSAAFCVKHQNIYICKT